MKRLTSFSAIAVISVSILMAVCVVSNITAQDLNYGDPKPERE